MISSKSRDLSPRMNPFVCLGEVFISDIIINDLTEAILSKILWENYIFIVYLVSLKIRIFCRSSSTYLNIYFAQIDHLKCPWHQQLSIWSWCSSGVIPFHRVLVSHSSEWIQLKWHEVSERDKSPDDSLLTSIVESASLWSADIKLPFYEWVPLNAL